DPRCRATIEPKLGGYTSVAAAAPVRAIEPASRCPPWKFTLLRIRENVWARAASFGNSSVNRQPGRRVAIVVNGPRYSAGAPGWASKRSRWLGPPPSQTSRSDRAFGASAAGAGPRPIAPRANGAAMPARRNVRRPTAWQVRDVKLPISIITVIPGAADLAEAR